MVVIEVVIGLVPVAFFASHFRGLRKVLGGGEGTEGMGSSIGVIFPLNLSSLRLPYPRTDREGRRHGALERPDRG